VRSAHFRMSVAVVALSLGGAVLAAGAAQAAPVTTITLDPSDVVFFEDPLEASGACVDGSSTAVVTVTQGSTVVDQVAATLDADLNYSITLDLTSGETDTATATVDCFAYAAADPLGSAEEEFFLVTDADFEEIPVTVTPSRVTIGSSFTITAECAPGTDTATVLAGSGDNDDAFLEEEVVPAADGTVTLTTVLKAGPLVDPGEAGALVICGAQHEPGGLGFADFTILAAPAAPAPRPVSAVPTLANTGSDNGPLAAVGAGLLLLGAGAYRTSRFLR
jgi:LPXTG-motif cell wall-anchored protein